MSYKIAEHESWVPGRKTNHTCVDLSEYVDDNTKEDLYLLKKPWERITYNKARQDGFDHKQSMKKALK